MKVSAIIPAFNEAETLPHVLDALKRSVYIDEIIVCDDGSTDSTALVAESCGATTVIRSPKNIGKGAAVMKCVNDAAGDIILMVDADLVGFETAHANALLEPVLSGACSMTVGIFKGGKLRTDLAHVAAGFLSGQRALSKHFFNDLNEKACDGYGLETVMSIIAARRGLNVCDVILRNVTHVTKEEKYGIIRGIKARLSMYRQIIRAAFISYFGG